MLFNLSGFKSIVAKHAAVITILAVLIPFIPGELGEGEYLGN